jgi:ANTAR domain/GAF domain
MSDERTSAELDLAAHLERVARALSDSAEGEHTRDEIVHQAVEEIPGVDSSSISVTSLHGLLTTVAVTDPLANQADLLQAEFAEGPCFDAGTTGRTQVSARVADDDRWPRYGPASADLGVVAQMSVNIYVVGTSGMALNLYARRPAAFEGSRQTAELVASQAAIAIGFSDAAAARQHAMLTRGVIGQSIGIAMERYQLDETRALAFLVRASRDGNIKLSTIAADLVGTLNAQTRR